LDYGPEIRKEEGEEGGGEERQKAEKGKDRKEGGEGLK
jgi:hypothetical protein